MSKPGLEIAPPTIAELEATREVLATSTYAEGLKDFKHKGVLVGRTVVIDGISTEAHQVIEQHFNPGQNFEPPKRSIQD